MSASHQSANSKNGFLPSLVSIRGLAAAYVVLFHTSSGHLGLQRSIYGQPFRFGLEAVMVFFLLSGFVIEYSTNNGSLIIWKKYLILRLRRIYPVFLLSLLLSYAVSCVAQGRVLSFNWVQCIENLAMTQDLYNKPGVWFLTFEGNGPLWSLSYEMAYYALYPLIMTQVRVKNQLFVATALSWGAVLINHFAPNPWCNFVSLLVLWWAGVELCREYRVTGRNSIRGQIKLLLALFPPFAYYVFLCRGLQTDHCLSSYPILEARFYGETLVMLALLPALQKLQLAGILKKSRVLLWIGGISFALYAFHYPLICNLPTARGIPLSIDLLLKIILLLVLSWLAESVFQPWVNRKTVWMLARVAPKLP